MRKDPTGKSHTITDNGTYFVDALDGEIINRERGVVENIAGLFKKKEERMESKEDKELSSPKPGTNRPNIEARALYIRLSGLGGGT